MRAEHDKRGAPWRGLVLISSPASGRDAASSRDVVTESRELWALLEPSQQEVDSAVTHVQRALREPYRSRRRRRMLPLVACVLLLGGAAAYAAQGGLRAFGQRDEPSATGALGSLAARADAVLRRLPVLADRPLSPIHSPSPAVSEQRASLSKAFNPGTGSAARRQQPASAAGVAEAREKAATEPSLEEESRARLWDTIGRALADGNTSLAEETLKELAASGHAPTVAKAVLGLSQLTLASGDCARARQGALTLLSHPGASSAVRRGAERILQNCE